MPDIFDYKSCWKARKHINDAKSLGLEDVAQQLEQEWYLMPWLIQVEEV